MQTRYLDIYFDAVVFSKVEVFSEGLKDFFKYSADFSEYMNFIYHNNFQL